MNRLQRQLEVLLKNYRILEARLEAGGVSVKSLGVRPLFQKCVHCLLAWQAHFCHAQWFLKSAHVAALPANDKIFVDLCPGSADTARMCAPGLQPHLPQHHPHRCCSLLHVSDSTQQGHTSPNGLWSCRCSRWIRTWRCTGAAA